MRCDLCPLCPPQGEYGDDVCPEMDGPYGMTHKDGMGGCRHPWNWVKKKDDEYTDHLAEMADGMVEMMRKEGKLSFHTDEITHWMPMPKPPKDENDG